MKKRLLNIPPELDEMLVVFAKYHGVSVTSVILSATNHYLKPLEKPRNEKEKEYNEKLRSI